MKRRWPGPNLAALVLAGALLAHPAGRAQLADAEPAYVHTTIAGDTVIGLGRRFLSEPARWPELARANALRNPNQIAVGTALRIPLRLMRTEAVAANVLSVIGEARSGLTGTSGASGA